MDIDLGDEVVFNVKYKGKVHKLREPTTDEVNKYMELTQGDDKSMSPFIAFVTELGLPQDVAGGLGITKIKKLADGLIGGLTEKK